MSQKQPKLAEPIDLDELIDRVAKGCQFKTRKGQTTWNCSGDFTVFERSLNDMKFTPSQKRALRDLVKSFAYCDCEIVLNQEKLMKAAKKHRVKAGGYNEDPNLKEISAKEQRSFAPISPITVYKSKSMGKKIFIGDGVLVRALASLKKAHSDLDLPERQLTAAIHMYNRFRKQQASKGGVKPRSVFGDVDVGSRALLFAAGREMKLSQRMNRFIPPGKSTLFFRYLTALGVKPKQENEVELMAKVNEAFTSLNIPPVSRLTVQQALKAKGTRAYRNVPGWIAAWAMWERSPGRWVPSVLGVKEHELASKLGMATYTIRDLYLKIGKYHEKKASK